MTVSYSKNNLLSTLDLSTCPSVRRITASKNKITSITGISDNLRFLDLSNNLSLSLKPLAPAKNLHVCILRNCQARDFSFLENTLSLLYLDLYNVGLMNSELDFLGNCNFLIYLNVGCNMYTQMPSIPTTIMLRELDLSGNEFGYVLI